MGSETSSSFPSRSTDQTGSKKRPAVVVSSQAYHQRRRDIIIMAVTSQMKPTFGEVPVTGWQQAGLLQPSVTKPILATIEKGLVIRRLGQLQDADRKALQNALNLILG